MAVSERTAAAVENGSFIRKMFERGNELRKKYGDDAVFDFSLGNPDAPPPAVFPRFSKKKLLNVCGNPAPINTVTCPTRVILKRVR